LLAPLVLARGSPTGIALRPYDFWKDFDVQVSSKDQQLKPFSSSRQPTFLCSEYGGCILTGATLQFDFSVEDFASGSAIIDVNPPKAMPSLSISTSTISADFFVLKRLTTPV
jgi:hypothetical protein